jgi:lipopolysaccharide transport system permease protein
MSEEHATQQGSGHARIVEISKTGRSFLADMHDLWAYRDLLFLLARRDITVRYKQSLLGVGWAVLQPLALMLVFTMVFGRFARMPSDGVPYPLFVLCGLLPWQFFSRTLASTSASLTSSNALVSKVYFPRLILPLSRTLSGLTDLSICFLMFFGVMAWYRVTPTWNILALPLLLALLVACALAAGIWLSALNVRYRDTGLAVPFITQVLMYASPVAYTSTVVPEKWKFVYGLNPIVGIVDGFRWSLIGRTAPDLATITSAVVIVLVILCAGIFFFRRIERSFADVI